MKNHETAALWRNFFIVADGLREMQGRLAEAEPVLHFTLSQLRMIKFVHLLTRDRAKGAKGGITLKELSETLGITAAAGSEMVDALVRKEVLAREQSREDRRSLSIRLKPEWEERFALSEAGFSRLAKEFLDSLPEPEREGLLKLTGAFAEFIAEKKKQNSEKRG